MPDRSPPMGLVSRVPFPETTFRAPAVVPPHSVVGRIDDDHTIKAVTHGRLSGLVGPYVVALYQVGIGVDENSDHSPPRDDVAFGAGGATHGVIARVKGDARQLTGNHPVVPHAEPHRASGQAADFAVAPVQQ